MQPTAVPGEPGARPALRPAPTDHDGPRSARYRANWYLGFGIGGGTGGIDDDRGFELSASAGLALLVRIGWVARPWLLVGYEGSLWSTPSEQDWRHVHHSDAMLTLFPFYDLGLYGRFGLGAAIVISREASTGDQLRADVGIDLKTGIGYEFQLGKAFNLGLDLSYARGSYTGGDAYDVCGAVTLLWY